MLYLSAPGLQGWRPDSIIMDAPRIYHADKFLVFLGVEGLLIAIGVLSYSAQGRPACDSFTLARPAVMEGHLSAKMPVIVSHGSLLENNQGARVC